MTEEEFLTNFTLSSRDIYELLEVAGAVEGETGQLARKTLGMINQWEQHLKRIGFEHG